MNQILSIILVFGLLFLGCKTSSNIIRPDDQKTEQWTGYPEESSDWKYRYVFDSPDMESGWVEYQSEGKWHVSGEFEDINRLGNTIRSKGPIGTDEKVFYIGYIFEILHSTEDSSLVQMTCDAFDSRYIILLFRKEIHNTFSQNQ